MRLTLYRNISRLRLFPSLPLRVICLDRLDNGYEPAIRRGFAFSESRGAIGPQDSVAIKPNLTYPTYRPGVMTNPQAIEALLRYLKDFTSRITVCEADSGGYNPFSMNEVFRATGLHEMTRRYGVRLVNLSEVESRNLAVRAGFRTLQIPMPRLLLDETDLFITVPVPKVHMNTVISGAIKNQWGTIRVPPKGFSCTRISRRWFMPSTSSILVPLPWSMGNTD